MASLLFLMYENLCTLGEKEEEEGYESRRLLLFIYSISSFVYSTAPPPLPFPSLPRADSTPLSDRPPPPQEGSRPMGLRREIHSSIPPILAGLKMRRDNSRLVEHFEMVSRHVVFADSNKVARGTFGFGKE